jgi:hypothetical protein
MKEYEIVAVLHDARRNGERCAKYWSVESDPESERPNDNEIHDQWFCKDLPKRISDVLKTAPDDPEEWGDKRGIFIIVLKNPLVFEDYGHVQSFDNVISIRTKNAPTDTKEVAETSNLGNKVRTRSYARKTLRFS